MENKDTITGGTGERTWCVYLYTFPDGMFYYGKSSVEGLVERHGDHARGGYDIGVWIRRWRLKGVEVKPGPVEFFGSEDAALAREKELIEETDAVNKGLNMCEGGGQPPVLCGDKNPMRRPEIAAKVSASMKKTLSCPARRAKRSARMKEYLAENPDKNPMRRPEVAAKQSATQKKRCEDIARRSRMSARMKKYYADNPDARARLSANNPMKDPKIAAKFSGANNPMKRPEVVAKFSGANNPMKRPEVVAKRLATMKRRKAAVVGA